MYSRFFSTASCAIREVMWRGATLKSKPKKSTTTTTATTATTTTTATVQNISTI